MKCLVKSILIMGLVYCARCVNAETLALYSFQDIATSSDTETNTTAGTFSYGAGSTIWGYSTGGQSGKSAFFSDGKFYSTNRTTAIALNDHLYFTVAVNSGSAVNFTNLSFYTSSDVTAGAGAPDSYSVFTSQDNYTTSVGTGMGAIVSEGATTFKKHTINLSGFTALQSVTNSTEFRIVLWTTDGTGASAAVRQFRLDTVNLEGTVSVVSEPLPGSATLIVAH
jgi:hypothetical protein